MGELQPRPGVPERKRRSAQSTRPASEPPSVENLASLFLRVVSEWSTTFRVAFLLFFMTALLVAAVAALHVISPELLGALSAHRGWVGSIVGVLVAGTAAARGAGRRRGGRARARKAAADEPALVA
jgi:hypothetical protein